MRRRQVLMRLVMLIALLSIWPGGVAAAAGPNRPESLPELPHLILPCIPPELPDPAVPIEDCTDEVPKSEDPDQAPQPERPGQAAQPEDRTKVPEQPPIPGQSPEVGTDRQPGDPEGPESGTIPCIPREIPDEAVPDSCPTTEREGPGDPAGSGGSRGPSDPPAQPGGQDSSPDRVGRDPGTGSGGADTGDGSAAERAPSPADSGSSPPAPDPPNPAEPATTASPSPGRPAIPAQPVTPARPSRSPEATQPTEPDSPSSPSSPRAPDRAETTDAASPEVRSVIEIEQVGELLPFLQPSAIPDVVGFDASDGAHLSSAGGRPPRPALAAGLELALPPRLENSQLSSEAGVDLVAQAVQQSLRGLALPLAVAGLLALGLPQAGVLSAVRKGWLRR